MIKVLLSLVLSGAVAFADAKKNPPCPQIDKTKLDVDGMPFCPSAVSESNAYAVFRCPLEVTNSFHTPTAKELGSMKSLLTAFATSTTAGVKADTTKVMLSSADELNLQACRVSQMRDNAKDSFLLFYTKPGVKDYSGPFMMLRETKHSKMVLIGPHDDSDGTFAVTKVAIAETSALALFSNGHKRGNIPGMTGRSTDFVHTENNLGTKAVHMFGELFPNHVWLHTHGMADPSKVLYRSHSKVYGAAFEKAVMAVTNIKEFKPLNAYFTVDNETNSGYYIKTEIPVRIYHNSDQSVARIVKELEKNDFVWQSPLQTTDDIQADPTKPGDVSDDGEDVVTVALPKPEEPAPESLEIDGEEEILIADAQADLSPEVAATATRPPMRPNKGRRTLLCIGVKYSTGEVAAEKPGCETLGRTLKGFWERNSRNAMLITPVGAEPFDSGLPGAKGPGGWQVARDSYKTAVSMIKKAYPNFNYYVIPGIYTGPHAGGKVAHVKSTQAMTATHETGHLIGLGHAGAYTYDGGKPVLNAYGDRDSIMGRIISKYITASQYYYLGWLKLEEIADYNKAVASYDLGLIAEWNGLQTVIVPPSYYGNGKGNWVFVSSTRCGKGPSCIAVHFDTGRGSQKIMEVEDEGWDPYFTGIHVKKLQTLPGKIRVSIDFESKPAAK